MANPENVEKKKHGDAERTQAETGSGGKLMPLLMPILAAVVFAGGGFFVGRMFGVRGNAQNVTAAEQAEVETEASEQATTDKDTEPSWYYDMESIVANLNEPGATRYVRVGLTLGIDSALSEKEGTPLLEKKTPLLKNWLTLYMANQTAANIQGEARLRVVQDEITDAFNKGLFGKKQGPIKQVLFKELSIQ